LIKSLFICCFVVTGGGGGNQQIYPGVDEYQNTGGGAKQQLLTLIRSVRTVMRSKSIPFSSILIDLYFYF
jgi:hypothetical protein